MNPDEESRLELTVERGGMRLDRLLSDKLGCGRRAARRLAREGRVTVDGRVTSACGPLETGTVVVLARDSHRTAVSTFDPGELLICRDESRAFCAFNKPAGVHSHAGRSPVSLAAMLSAYDPRFLATSARKEEAGLVHRLDRDTSGVMIAALSRDSYSRWREAFRDSRTRKWYLALVSGVLDAPEVLDIPLARRSTGVVAARRHDRALRAVTELAPLETGKSWSLVEARMSTGVTHQVRAHLSLRGYPILGDLKYGDVPAPAGTRNGHLLHALRLSDDTGIDVTAPVPVDFCAAYARLKSGSTRP